MVALTWPKQCGKMCDRENANPKYEPLARSLARSAPCVFSRAGVRYLQEKTQMAKQIEVKAGDRYGRLTIPTGTRRQQCRPTQ